MQSRINCRNLFTIFNSSSGRYSRKSSMLLNCSFWNLFIRFYCRLSFKGITSFNPDQVSSIAQTLILNQNLTKVLFCSQLFDYALLAVYPVFSQEVKLKSSCFSFHPFGLYNKLRCFQERKFHFYYSR